MRDGGRVHRKSAPGMDGEDGITLDGPAEATSRSRCPRTYRIEAIGETRATRVWVGLETLALGLKVSSRLHLGRHACMILILTLCAQARSGLPWGARGNGRNVSLRSTRVQPIHEPDAYRVVVACRIRWQAGSSGFCAGQ